MTEEQGNNWLTIKGNVVELNNKWNKYNN
jgi:hypothetical protein